MGPFSSCCGIGSLIPPDSNELSREERIQLYRHSVALNRGKLIVHGLFARADIVNVNKRLYPKRVFKREVAKYQRQHIRRATALGELDHPSYSSTYFRRLNLPNVSHQVLEVHWRGSQLWGTIEVLPTPSGLLLWELYAQGIKLGVSSRGWASLVCDPRINGLVVDDDFELITFDFVADPSNSGAFLYPVHKKYRKPIPDQATAIQLSHLHVGSTPMPAIPLLPHPHKVQKLLNKYLMAWQQAAGVGAPQQQQDPKAPALRPPPLAAAAGAAATAAAAVAVPPVSVPPAPPVVLELSSSQVPQRGFSLVSHYYLEPAVPGVARDPQGRNYQLHLTTITTRAHLAEARASKLQQQQKAPGSPQQQQQQEGLTAVGAAERPAVGQLKHLPLQQQAVSVLAPPLQQQQQQAGVVGQQRREHQNAEVSPRQQRHQQQQQERQPIEQLPLLQQQQEQQVMAANQQPGQQQEEEERLQQQRHLLADQQPLESLPLLQQQGQEVVPEHDQPQQPQQQQQQQQGMAHLPSMGQEGPRGQEGLSLEPKESIQQQQQQQLQQPLQEVLQCDKQQQLLAPSGQLGGMADDLPACSSSSVLPELHMPGEVVDLGPCAALQPAVVQQQQQQLWLRGLDHPQEEQLLEQPQQAPQQLELHAAGSTAATWQQHHQQQGAQEQEQLLQPASVALLQLQEQQQQQQEQGYALEGPHGVCDDDGMADGSDDAAELLLGPMGCCLQADGTYQDIKHTLQSYSSKCRSQEAATLADAAAAAAAAAVAVAAGCDRSSGAPAGQQVLEEITAMPTSMLN